MTIQTKAGKVTATKETLNYISMLALYASEKYSERGLDALAEEAENFANEIYELLKETGYYAE